MPLGPTMDLIHDYLEVFTSTDGQTANNPIVGPPGHRQGVSMEDYWDLNAIANTAGFQSGAAARDFTWVFELDGTGHAVHCPLSISSSIGHPLGPSRHA
ncbi:hypothetical protein [Mycobacterium sp.]|uniref:hypothetical protein n=1 Tax=Mycobacterium sp. TaxID=1785 RepID=UPI003C78EADD